MNIALQVGSELRITKNRERPEAAGAIDYRVDARTEHIPGLIDPVADRKHMAEHRRGD